MGEKVGALTDFSFDLPDEDYYVLKVEDVEVVPIDGGGLTYKLTSVIDGGPFDGQKHWDNFGTRVKKHFGIRKMLGFLVKAGKVAEDTTLDTDFVETAEFQKQFKQMVKGARFGAYLSHREWTDKEGKNKKSTNADKYMTVDEVRAKWQEAKKPDQGGTVNKDEPVAKPPEAPKQQSIWK